MQINKVWASCLAIVVMSFAFNAMAAKETVADRIKPVGELCKAGEPCAAATGGGGEARSGKAVYDTKCMACHATGAAGAPKLGDAAQWGARLTERKTEGLYNSSISGFKAMPPKGLCMDCSDDELKAAVDYILENSK